jgi:hypothetical protein
MSGTIIERQIRRCNRNLFLVNAGVIGLLLLWVLLAQRYLYNCAAGPFPIAAADLQSKYSYPDKQEFLAVTDELRPVDTGVYLRHTSNGAETSRDYFLATRVGDHFLLIKSEIVTPAKHYEGILAPIPTDVRDLIAADVKKKGADFDSLFLPFMLDSTNYRSNAFLAVGIGLLIFALCAYNVAKAFARIEDHRRSPIYRALQRYGDPNLIAPVLEGEVASGNVTKYGPFTLTPSWLLHGTFFTFTPFHLSDIVWVYKKRTQHSYYFVIPTGKSYAITIRDAAGRKAEADLGRGKRAQQRVDEFITALSARIPWAVAGYSDEVKKLYEKDRDAFLAAIAQRQQEHNNKNS